MSNTKKLKFFIVDDDPFSRMLYNQHLLNMGYKNNVLLDNGIDCINKLELEPDIIFLDYDMQPINGLEVLKKVKESKNDIFILIISQHKDKQIVLDSFKHGAFDYIVKGDHDLEMISTAVNKIISTREQSYEHEMMIA